MLTCPHPVLKPNSVISGTPVTLNYSVTNEGKETYKLKASSSCGCSTPSLSKREIQPGETIDVKVVFDSLGKSGLLEKNIYVFYEGEKNHGRLTMQFIIDVQKKV